MSKAFTRESDDAPEEITLPRQPAPLPPGVKNYITADGAERLREELKHLTEEERPRIVASIDPEDHASLRRELAGIDQRIAYLGQSLESAVVVEPSTGTEDHVVRFGSTVTVRDKAGTISTYRLVGVDETDMDRDWISWRSPLATALLNRNMGDQVRLRLPGREEELEIINVSYETPRT